MSKYLKLMTQVVRTTSVPEKFGLSHPSKISLTDRCAFSVPAGPKFACPGATDACTGCYAQKFRHLWGPVQKSMAKNWNLLKKFENDNHASGASSALLAAIRNDAKIFRLYESGDFHSQWVIDVWSEVVSSRKDVEFWAYTRSFNLDFTKLTRNKNFSLWASTDNYNIKEAKQFVRRFKKSGVKHAYGPWEHNVPSPTNSFICPVTSGKMELLGACEKCRLCVKKKLVSKNVVFLKH